MAPSVMVPWVHWPGHSETGTLPVLSNGNYLIVSDRKVTVRRRRRFLTRQDLRRRLPDYGGVAVQGSFHIFLGAGRVWHTVPRFIRRGSCARESAPPAFALRTRLPAKGPGSGDCRLIRSRAATAGKPGSLRGHTSHFHFARCPRAPHAAAAARPPRQTAQRPTSPHPSWPRRARTRLTWSRSLRARLLGPGASRAGNTGGVARDDTSARGVISPPAAAGVLLLAEMAEPTRRFGSGLPALPVPEAAGTPAAVRPGCASRPARAGRRYGSGPPGPPPVPEHRFLVSASLSVTRQAPLSCRATVFHAPRTKA